MGVIINILSRKKKEGGERWGSNSMFSMPLRIELYYWLLTKSRLNLHGDGDQKGYQDSTGSGTERGGLASILTKGS